MLMKKIFSLFAAAILAMTVSADPIQQDIPLDQASWQWGYNSTVTVANNVLSCTLTGEWGAASTGWDPTTDLSSWDKIVIVVESMSGCDGEWFKLKAYLRDNTESEPNQMEGQLGLDAPDNQQNNLIIDLHQQKACDLTQAKILAIQCQPNGAVFTISRVYLEKETVAPAQPDTAYGVTRDEADVMALYCNYYTTNNLNFTPQGWGTGWQTLSLAGTNVAYTTGLAWDAIMGATESVDLSAYKHLHFDVWAPDTAHVCFTIEAKSGYKQPVDFKINPGWNTIDADPAWWNTDSTTYDWKDVKCVLFEKYKKADGETSFEGNPFAFANIYMWNDPAPKNIPATAPAAPTRAESKIQALFSATYKERTFNFAPTSWGTQWVNYKYTTGEEIYHTESMAWDGFTNWDASSYNLTAYDMMHADVYVTVNSKLQFTIEALAAGEGGSGWKNGASFDLVANQWNSIDIDLLNAPFDSYDFTDMRYLILEGFKNPDGSSAEGTPLSIANVYFWNSMDQAVENVEAGQKATKRLIDGKLVIEKNGVRYNAIGTKF